MTSQIRVVRTSAAPDIDVAPGLFALSRDLVPGFTVSAVVGDEQVTVSAGRRSEKAEMDENSRLPLGCIMKLLIAVTALRLCESGRIALDDEVSSYLPELQIGGTTIRHLLCHSGGYREPPAQVARWNFSWEDFSIFIRNREQVFEPGTAWSYTQSGPIIVARIIEQVTGRPIQQEIEDQLLRPLGIAPMTRHGEPESADRDALLYRFVLQTRRNMPMKLPRDNGVFRYSISDLTLNASELARLGAAIAASEELLSPPMRELLFGKQMEVGPVLRSAGAESLPTAWGLGIGHFGRLIGHTGSYVACTSALYLDPARGSAVAMSMNCWDTMQRQRLAAHVTAQLGFPPPDEGVQWQESPYQMSDLAGEYDPLMLGASSLRIGEDGTLSGGIRGMLERSGEGRLSLVTNDPNGAISIEQHPQTGEPLVRTGYSLYTRKAAGHG